MALCGEIAQAWISKLEAQMTVKLGAMACLGHRLAIAVFIVAMVRLDPSVDRRNVLRKLLPAAKSSRCDVAE